MRVWLDEDLCSGCGCCTMHCPEVFGRNESDLAVVLRDGVPQPNLTLAEVPKALEGKVQEAASDCPGEIIFIEIDILTMVLHKFKSLAWASHLMFLKEIEQKPDPEGDRCLTRLVKGLSPSAYATLCFFGDNVSRHGQLADDHHWLKVALFYGLRTGSYLPTVCDHPDPLASSRDIKEIMDRLSYLAELIGIGVLRCDDNYEHVSLTELGQYMYETRDDYYRRFEEVA